MSSLLGYSVPPFWEISLWVGVVVVLLTMALFVIFGSVRQTDEQEDVALDSSQQQKLRERLAEMSHTTIPPAEIKKRA